MTPKQIAVLNGKVVARTYEGSIHSKDNYTLEWIQLPRLPVWQGTTMPQFISRTSHVVLKRIVERHFPGVEWGDAS